MPKGKSSYAVLMSLSVFALFLLILAQNARAEFVYSNSAAPGDTFSVSGGSKQGQAVGATGWYYNNVRYSGSAGINDTYARSGNGSAMLVTTQGPGGNSSKADIEFLAGGALSSGNYKATSTLGYFSDFVGMSYDWYRDVSSSNSGVQHPALRILLDADGDLNTTGDQGGLVFERAYNGGGDVTEGVWTTDTVTSTTKVWNFGLGFPNEYNINGAGSVYDEISDWQAYFNSRDMNAVILGFSAGVGSGWGPFSGAVDNISWTIGELTATYNFEVQGAAPSVPEPGTMLLMGLGGAGMAFLRRRKAARAK